MPLRSIQFFSLLSVDQITGIGPSRVSAPAIGAKRGGTHEQCSQKLFEMAEICKKIIIFINYKFI